MNAILWVAIAIGAIVMYLTIAWVFIQVILIDVNNLGEFDKGRKQGNKRGEKTLPSYSSK